jgi:hypothetical protein
MSSTSKLPERPSLEYLRKLAKERLAELRAAEPRARLAAAQLAVAREHGLPSWRALVAEVVARRAAHDAEFLDACARGDTAAARESLQRDAGLVRARRPPHGSTGLHLAAAAGHLDVARLLLDRGADADARDTGDSASPLHLAAGGGHIEIVRALLDADADVHGAGDVHEADVIGWASSLQPRGAIRRDVVALLLERGARHHIFSAIAAGDPALILSAGGSARDVTLWFTVDAIDPLYRLFKERQLRVAQAALSGQPIDQPEVRFAEDLYEPFYGGRQFSVIDPGGIHLVFHER